jgi:hypothetical protein
MPGSIAFAAIDFECLNVALSFCDLMLFPIPAFSKTAVALDALVIFNVAQLVARNDASRRGGFCVHGVPFCAVWRVSAGVLGAQQLGERFGLRPITEALSASPCYAGSDRERCG